MWWWGHVWPYSALLKRMYDVVGIPILLDASAGVLPPCTTDLIKIRDMWGRCAWRSDKKGKSNGIMFEVKNKKRWHANHSAWQVQAGLWSICALCSLNGNILIWLSDVFLKTQLWSDTPGVLQVIWGIVHLLYLSLFFLNVTEFECGKRRLSLDCYLALIRHWSMIPVFKSRLDSQ